MLAPAGCSLQLRLWSPGHRRRSARRLLLPGRVSSRAVSGGRELGGCNDDDSCHARRRQVAAEQAMQQVGSHARLRAGDGVGCLAPAGPTLRQDSRCRCSYKSNSGKGCDAAGNAVRNCSQIDSVPEPAAQANQIMCCSPYLAHHVGKYMRRRTAELTMAAATVGASVWHPAVCILRLPAAPTPKRLPRLPVGRSCS